MNRIVTTFCFIALLSNLSFTQQLVWQHTGGPMGGTIGDMAINTMGDIFCGMYPVYQSGLYKSTNNGDSWNKIETQFEDFRVFSVYITNENHMWIGTDFQGALYRSTDNGNTWENKASGYNSFECWAIGESNDGILFAGDANSSELYRSTDSGENWVFSAFISPLAFAVDSNNVVYAGSFNGLYLSTDNGITWTQNNFLAGFAVSTVLIDSSSNIYCGTGYASVGGDGLFSSNDGGQSWIQLGLAEKVVLSLAFDSEENLFAGTLYDGLFKTTDMGLKWKQYQNGIYSKQVYRLKINKQDDIFIGSEGGGEGGYFYGGGGIFRSTNGGDSFEQVGLPISRVKNIVFGGDSLIITSTPSGVQKYNRFTKKWKNLGLHNIEAVSITPSNYLYAAARDEGLFKSTDIGDTWLLTDLTADSIFPVYNVLALNDDTLFASTSYNLRRSTNGGQDWDNLPINTGDNSRGLIFNSNVLWSTGYSSGTRTLYKTTNFGASFDSLYSGFRTWDSNNPISATNNGYVFLASRDSNLDGIIRSTNDGLHWDQVLFINNTKTTVFANDDGIVITGTTVFSFSDTNKIYISTDYGNSWSGIIQPTAFGISITDIKQDPMNKFFFGTSSDGLYEVDIVTNIEEDPFLNYNYFLSQNYPNPFNPVTTIPFSMKNEGLVKIEIYNILGAKVRTLLNENKTAGNHVVKFDASGLSSGVYLYKFITGKFVDVRKMIMLK